MIRLFFAFILALLLSPIAIAAPFWGDRHSQPVDTAPSALKPGQFIWKGDAVPNGPVVVVVSLPEQRTYVYRNGIRIGVTSSSTGKIGHETPTGVFMVLQKDKDHRSKKYNNAPMPYTERLTWDGISLHAGGLPGYPSSHGCVHLPTEFARRLFEVSPKGMTVVIANEHNNPREVAHPPAISPVGFKKGKTLNVPRLTASEEFRWQPEKSPEGPMSIILSGADRRVLVYRNGVEIGRAKLSILNPTLALGTRAFIMQEGFTESASLFVKNAPSHRWLAVDIPGRVNQRGSLLSANQAERIYMPPRFAEAIYRSLSPGTTLLITDATILEQQTTNVALNIMNTDEQVVERKATF